jgi:hypothetical protein
MKEIADILSKIMTTIMEITNAKNKTGKIACCNKEKNGIKNHHYCRFKTKITVNNRNRR